MMAARVKVILIISYLLVSTNTLPIEDKKSTEAEEKLQSSGKEPRNVCDSNRWAGQVCQLCAILYNGFQVTDCCSSVYEIEACTFKLADDIYTGGENDVDNGHLNTFQKQYKYEEPADSFKDKKYEVKRYGSTFNPWGWSVRRKSPKKNNTKPQHVTYSEPSPNDEKTETTVHLLSPEKRYGSLFNKWNWSNKDKRYGSTFNKWYWSPKHKKYGSMFNRWNWNRKSPSKRFDKWDWLDLGDMDKRYKGAFDKWNWQDLGELEKRSLQEAEWDDIGEPEKRYGSTFNRWNWKKKN